MIELFELKTVYYVTIRKHTGEVVSRRRVGRENLDRLIREAIKWDAVVVGIWAVPPDSASPSPGALSDLLDAGMDQGTLSNSAPTP